MHLKNCVAASYRRAAPHTTIVAGSVFIALVTAGSLVSISCAHTPAGLAREEQLYLVTSNAMATVKQATPYAPPPCNQILEGILATGGALMALWATHLQRSLADLRNGKPGVTLPAGPGVPPAGKA
jgi:hypothetical protein